MVHVPFGPSMFISKWNFKKKRNNTSYFNHLLIIKKKTTEKHAIFLFLLCCTKIENRKKTKQKYVRIFQCIFHITQKDNTESRCPRTHNSITLLYYSITSALLPWHQWRTLWFPVAIQPPYLNSSIIFEYLSNLSVTHRKCLL